MGCEGCELWTKSSKLCYAGLLHQQRGNHKGYASVFEIPEMFEGRMDKAIKWKSLEGKERLGSDKVTAKPWLNALPRTIFLGDMGDLFSVSITDKFIYEEVVQKAVNAAQHVWMLLTKRPKRMAEMFGGGSCVIDCKNIWGMTSITSNVSMKRINWLRKTSFHIRGLSIEPLMEHLHDLPAQLEGIDWVIVGGMSGSGNIPRTELQWIGKVVEACHNRRVPVFVKQLGTGHIRGDLKGSRMEGWPRELRVRQMPLQKITPPDGWKFNTTEYYATKDDWFDQSSPNVLNGGKIHL